MMPRPADLTLSSATAGSHGLMACLHGMTCWFMLHARARALHHLFIYGWSGSGCPVIAGWGRPGTVRNSRPPRHQTWHASSSAGTRPQHRCCHWPSCQLRQKCAEIPLHKVAVPCGEKCHVGNGGPPRRDLAGTVGGQRSRGSRRLACSSRPVDQGRAPDPRRSRAGGVPPRDGDLAGHRGRDPPRSALPADLH